jgi:hypothetical protein
LEAFQHWRRAPDNECGIFSFRATLPKVTEWLHQSTEGSTDSLGEVLVWQILGMLRKEPERRTPAKDHVKFLVNNQRRSFFALVIKYTRRQWNDRMPCILSCVCLPNSGVFFRCKARLVNPLKWFWNWDILFPRVIIYDILHFLEPLTCYSVHVFYHDLLLIHLLGPRDRFLSPKSLNSPG